MSREEHMDATNGSEHVVPYASLGQLVDTAAARFGANPLWVSIDGDTSLSFSEFAAATRRCANGFSAVGVKPGAHVAVMLPNVPAYVITWIALARLGAVMVPVNTQYTPRELEYVLEDSDASVLVIDETYTPTFDGIDNNNSERLVA